MRMPLVSIIILTYGNGWEHVQKCFRSLQKVTYPRFEVILIDNGSERMADGEWLMANRKFRVTVIKNKKNLGFCTGNNQGVKKAKGTYILLLNNDTIVTPGFLTKLVATLEKDKTAGAVQPKIRQLADKDKLDACASFLTSTGFLYHYGYSQKQSLKKYNVPLTMYSVKGACFLTRKSLIEKIGLFDDDYFAYFEETDFCHRVWLSGYKVLYEPETEIFHLGGVGKHVSSTIQFHSYKNRLQTYIKNFEVKTLTRVLPVHILFCLGIAGVYLIKLNYIYSYAILKSIIWNLIHVKMLMKKRRFVQNKIRVVADADFFDTIEKNVQLSYYKHLLLNPRGYFNYEKI